jgi:hypothetical protein
MPSTSMPNNFARPIRAASRLAAISSLEGMHPTCAQHVRVCGKPDQTGCALQWNAVEPGANLDAVAAAYQKGFIATYGDSAPGRLTLCVNPVTFDRSKPNSLSAQAKGAVPGAPGYGSLLPLRPGAVAVRCDHGLAVSYLYPLLNLKALPGGALHYHDIGLFYADVRANAVLRTNAWLRRHRLRD